MFNLKNYLKISVLYTFAASFPALLQIFVLPIIEGAGRLNAIDFSQMAIAESISTFVGTIILFSMSGAISRFYYDYQNNAQNVNTLISTIITGILFRGLIVIGAAMLIGNHMAALFSQPDLHNFSSYGYGSIVIAINRSVIVVAATLYRNQKQVSRFIIINLAIAITRTIGQLAGIFFFDMSFVGYVNGAAIGGGIVTATVIIIIFKNSRLTYSSSMVKPLRKFAFPLFVFELVRWGVMFTDRLFLESSPEQLGIYDNAQRFAAGIYIIFQGLYGAVQPDFFRFLNEGIDKTLSDLRRLSNIYMLQAQTSVIVLIIPVIIYIYLFFSTTLSTSGTLITIIFAQYIITAVNTLFSMPIIFHKRTDIFLYINLLVLSISLSINYFLTSKIGYYGAIIASYTANTIQMILLVVAQNRTIKIKWNYAKTIAVPMSIVACAVLTEIIKHKLAINYVTASIGFIATALLILAVLYRHETRNLILKVAGKVHLKI